MNNIELIIFDADDTLWVNETYFHETRDKYVRLFEQYMPHEQTGKELAITEQQNMELYGYGVKPFTLSMIETAVYIAKENLSRDMVFDIINLGKDILNQPVRILEGVEEVLKELKEKYKLAVATKGDLLDQRRKLNESGLIGYFDHVEVMSDKTPIDYQSIFTSLNVAPENALMIGNSVRSDILPILELGGYAVHIPFSVTWDHEEVKGEIQHLRFAKLENIKEVLNLNVLQ